MMRRFHPARPDQGARLYGKRIVLRPLTSADYPAWAEVRHRNDDWLVPWEPKPSFFERFGSAREAFNARCSARDRERQNDQGYGFGVFVDGAFAGEINLNGVVRGASQMATIGYWIDRARAGNRYIAEGVVAVLRFSFEHLGLHRVEICIIPRNARSHRVPQVLGLRDEGLAERFLQINGVWEDHVRYAITAEEWQARRGELCAEWLGPPQA